MTTQPDRTIIYTPFPDYEVEASPTGAETVRTTYRLGGQIVAVQTKVGAAAGAFYFTYTDHLGNIAALGQGSGVVAGSVARFDPFGNYRTTPATTTNPAISNHGFTGHRMNNTGANDLGLIYMNARYYMPEVGRFVSADTIVPEPRNPQSFNRYSYVSNNPVNYTDPSGHCAETGDDSCWSLAEQLSHLYDLDLEFLGVMNYDDLSFFRETFSLINDHQRSHVIASIQKALANNVAKKQLLDRGNWDVIGVRLDGSLSGIFGANLSSDFVWNFNSREFSLLINLNGTAGVQFGTAGAGGVFLGFDAPSNSAFAGWGTGLTFGGAIPGVGGTVQLDSSGKVIGLNELWKVKGKSIGATFGVDTFDLAIMYSTGVEAELSYSVGYTWMVPLHSIP